VRHGSERRRRKRRFLGLFLISSVDSRPWHRWEPELPELFQVICQRAPFSTFLARALAARGVHYGRVMLALAFGCGICATATLSIPGMLLVPMATEFGWSIGDFSAPRWKAGRHGVGWF
jgi:hypothetical protein